jgi:predicted MFS family arabinose efflux permease
LTDKIFQSLIKQTKPNNGICLRRVLETNEVEQYAQCAFSSVFMFIALFPRKRDRVLLLPIVGAQLIIGTSLFLLPVLVDVLSYHAGLSGKAAGLLVGMELATAALTTIFLSVWSPRHSARRWAHYGVFLAIVGTTLTLVSPALPILISSRLLAGIGAGLVGAGATSVLSRVIDRERVIAIVTIISILDAAFWLAVLPYLVDTFGYRAPYISLLLVDLVAVPLLMRLPGLRSKPAKTCDASISSSTLSVLVVAAVFLTQLGQGAFWSMEGRYGSNAGFSSHAIGVVLSISTLVLLSGAAGAAWAGDRFGRFATLLVLLTANALAIFLVGIVATPVVYIAANVLQSVTNLSSVIYQLGLSASLDRTGRTVAVATALVTLGNGIGPGLSASLSGIFGAPSVAVLATGLSGAALVLYCVVMMRQADEPQMAPSLT